MRTSSASWLACGLIACANASTPRLDVTDYFRTSFTPAQGAPAIIGRLAQTSDGFLWLGTPAGLYRFDGMRFERINAAGTSPIMELMAPPSGGLWIGHQYGGISFLDGHGVRNYPVEKGGLPDGSVKSFALDLDGVFWAGTTHGLARFDGQHWTDVTESLGLPKPNILGLQSDARGNVWINVANKVAVLRRGTSRVHVYGLSVSSNTFVKDPAGRVWAQEDRFACVYLLDPARDDDPPCRPVPPEYHDFWLIDQSGRLWGGDPVEHLRILPVPPEPDPAAPVPERTSMGTRPFVAFEGQMTDALQDREGNLWFGTTAGLEQLRASKLISHGPFGYSVVLGAGNHNSLWLGTSHSEPRPAPDFFQLKDGVMAPYAGGPTEIGVSYRDRTGVLWVGGQGRLWKLDDRTWEEVTVPTEMMTTSGDPLHRVQAIARDAQGTLWLSVLRTGLFKLQNRQWSRVEVPGIPASDYPTVMYTDANDSVWLGYTHGRAVSLTQGTWRLYAEGDGLSVGNVQVVSEVNGQIWIGGDLGVGRIRGDRFELLPTLNPLGSITGLMQAKNGDVWLNTSTGAVHIAKQEVGRLTANPATTPVYETLDFWDGMPGVALPPRPLPTVLQSDDGRIWFDVADHYASVDPSERLAIPVPTVTILSITDDARHRDPAGTALALFPNVRNLAVEYTATSLSIPSRVRFKYRLENFDKNWQDVGTRRTAYYNDLPPGHYVFRVIADNGDGAWNAQGATVALTVPPLFYQTSWFKILCLGILVLAVTALFFGVVRQLTQRQRKRLEQRMEDRVDERMRIARELHDTLLQSFQGLLLRFQVAYELLPARPTEARQDLGSAIDRTVQAINEGRNAVQGLRASAAERDDLGVAINTLAEELAGGDYGDEMGFHVDVQGTARPLHPIVRDEIYQIAGEALRNSRRHAHASGIEVELRYDERQLRLRIRDNGRGIDPKFLGREGTTGHYGLHGMRERAELIGGKLTIWTAAGSGTELELTVPAARAYAATPSGRLTWLPKRFSRKISEMTHD